MEREGEDGEAAADDSQGLAIRLDIASAYWILGTLGIKDRAS